MKLAFERSVPGRVGCRIPASDVKSAALPDSLLRTTPLHMPELTETDVSRHYSELEQQVYGVNDGFYPLGSCTMKYNPAVNEQTVFQLASLSKPVGATAVAGVVGRGDIAWDQPVVSVLPAAAAG